jgi:hypothetical protein
LRHTFNEGPFAKTIPNLKTSTRDNGTAVCSADLLVDLPGRVRTITEVAQRERNDRRFQGAIFAVPME